MTTQPVTSPARDNIPLDHPRRIARIAHSPVHTLALESTEVQRLCAEYRKAEAVRYAVYHGQGSSTPSAPDDLYAARILLGRDNTLEWTVTTLTDLERCGWSRQQIRTMHTEGRLFRVCPLDPSDPAIS